MPAGTRTTWRLEHETKAMQDYAYAQLRADHGLLNLVGCADGTPGCRQQYFPQVSNIGLDAETEKQTLLRNNRWGRALASGRAELALLHGHAVPVLQPLGGRDCPAEVAQLLLGGGDEGRRQARHRWRAGV